ncbi:MAG: site-specific DNA-methyltransferase, partial [Nanoarchaeota archaeon]|nr:site-specific DNA-methyltransferase [Nanoarchaeota archaeon]
MKTSHQIIQGDCIKELKKIADESIDLVFADPPYGLAKKKGLGWKYSKHITLEEKWDIFSKDEYLQFSQEWIKEALRVLKHGGSLWICGSFHNIYTMGYILQHVEDVKIN